MSTKKQSREKRRKQRALPSARRSFPTSTIFIVLIVLMVAVAAVAAAVAGRGDPTCPPGQVWSDAHNHCH